MTLHLILGLCLGIITVFGVSGNAISFLVWTKGRRCKNCSGAVYLRFLAISDTLVLCIPSLELLCFLLKPAGLLRDLNPVFCKIFPISPFFLVQMSTWTVVCLTLEQTVAVCRPFITTELQSKWRHYVIVFIITVVSFADNIPLIFAFDWGLQITSVSQTINVSSDSSTEANATEKANVNAIGKASVNQTYSSIIYHCSGYLSSAEHLFIVQLGLIAVIPILIIPTCNTIILIKMNRQNQMLTSLGSRAHGQTRNTAIIAMLKRTVAIGFVQCATSIPIVIMDIFFIFEPGDVVASSSYIICNTVYYLNNAVNVIFYCLLGRNFRDDCAELFKQCTYGNGSMSTAIETISPLETVPRTLSQQQLRCASASEFSVSNTDSTNPIDIPCK